MRIKHPSSLVMSPATLPQQRLSSVTDIPIRPKELGIFSVWGDSEMEKPQPRSPRNIRFVCSTEWSWDPWHERIDNLYLGRRHKRWVLWNNWVEDGGYPWTWHWDYLCYTSPVSDIEPYTVAVHMLLNMWMEEKSEGWLDEAPHRITREGLLDVSTIHSICREVWDE